MPREGRPQQALGKVKLPSTWRERAEGGGLSPGLWLSWGMGEQGPGGAALA